MTDLQALWKYQEANLALDELKKQIDQSESHIKYKKLHRQLSDLQKKKVALQELLESSANQLKEFETSIEALEHRYELESAEVESMRGDDECTADEAQESAKAIESLLNDVKKQKAAMMKLVDTLSKAQAKLEEVLTRGGKAKKEYDEVKALCAEEDAAHKSSVAELKAVITERAKDVKDASLLRRFESIKKHHADPLAVVEDDKCSACKMGLPTALVYKVVSNHEIVECENCGRMLCSPEDM